jgi:hypothetical protein
LRFTLDATGRRGRARVDSLDRGAVRASGAAFRERPAEATRRWHAATDAEPARPPTVSGLISLFVARFVH